MKKKRGNKHKKVKITKLKKHNVGVSNVSACMGV